MDEKKTAEQMLAELMSTIGIQSLAAIFNLLEPIKQKELAEIDALKLEKTGLIEEVTALTRDREALANSNSQLGAENLQLKAERRAFLLGEDLVDAEKFLHDVERFREEA
jgi:hypothetical protein